MHINVSLATESEQGQYLVRCARIRNVAVSRLVDQLVRRIVDDQLVAAVLDDEGRPAPREKFAKRFREIA